MVKRLPLSKRPSSVISLRICHFISIIQIQRAVRPHHRELEVSLAHFFYPITMDLSLPPSTLPLVFFFFFLTSPLSAFSLSDHVIKFKNKCICYDYTLEFCVSDCKIRLMFLKVNIENQTYSFPLLHLKLILLKYNSDSLFLLCFFF